MECGPRRRDGVSWHNTAKPGGEVVEVNQAAVRGRTVFLPGEWERSGHGGPFFPFPGALISRL